jgi:uncharacterized membrane protein
LKEIRGVKKIPKTVLKTRFKVRKKTYTLVFGIYLVISIWSHSIEAFSVFLEGSLRINSGTLRAGKKSKTRFGFSALKLTKNR